MAGTRTWSSVSAVPRALLTGGHPHTAAVSGRDAAGRAGSRIAKRATSATKSTKPHCQETAQVVRRLLPAGTSCRCRSCAGGDHVMVEPVADVGLTDRAVLLLRVPPAVRRPRRTHSGQPWSSSSASMSRIP